MMANWNFGGRNALEGGNTNSAASIPFPIGTYKRMTTSMNCPENNELSTENIADGIYRAANTLIAASTIPTNGIVTLNAGAEIVLKPGFHAHTESQFLAKIAPCPNNSSQTIIRPQVSAQIISNNNKDLNKLSLPNFDWTVYPNPTSTDLTVDLQLQAVTTIELHLVDVSGRLVHTLQPKQRLLEGDYRFQVNLNGVQAGIYWLQLFGEEEQSVKKVVIIK